MVRYDAYERMLYNHIQYLTWATGGTESQNLFEGLDYYATDVALGKLQAIHPNASYANTSGAGVEPIKQLLSLGPDTMSAVGFNTYSPALTSTLAHHALPHLALAHPHHTPSIPFPVA